MDVQEQERNWMMSLFKRLGNDHPSQSCQRFMIAWMRSEGGWFKNDCHYNCLNTKRDIEGAIPCTKGGVKSYRNLTDGIEASVLSLENGLYTHLLSALKTNDPHNLLKAPFKQYVREDLTMWVDGVYQPVNESYVRLVQNVLRGIL